jgi:RNA-binding protein PNO1
MVVAQIQPGPSVPKKNRRKMAKKSPRTPDVDMEMKDTERPSITESAGAEDDEVMIDANSTEGLPASSAPAFPPLSAEAQRTLLKSETRRIPIPPHRMTPLKKDWVNIFGPLTEILGLQVRMNIQRKCVEARVSFFSFPQSLHALLIP